MASTSTYKRQRYEQPHAEMCHDKQITQKQKIEFLFFISCHCVYTDPH